MSEEGDDNGLPIPSGKIPAKIGLYEVEGIIGNGAYGVVVCARHPADGEKYAIKITSRRLLDENSVLGAFEQECRIHQSLNHENIVRFLGIIYDPDFIFVILELCRAGDLLDYIQANPNRPNRRVLSFFYQILNAVAYLHERGIAHLDIKPENILLSDVQTVKLADFGCCEAPPKYDRGNARGTLKYSAPEILTCPRTDNRPADVWSLGILLFTMSAGMLPFPPGTDEEIAQRIIKGQLIVPSTIHPEIATMVRDCCQVDPDQRPLVSDLMSNWLFDFVRQEGLHPGTRACSSELGFPKLIPQQPSPSAQKKAVIVRPEPMMGSPIAGAIATRKRSAGSFSVRPRGIMPSVSGMGLPGSLPRPISPSPQLAMKGTREATFL
jgi:serine/threonine protein kinase